MTTKNSISSLLMACGALAAFAGSASAQLTPTPPYLINLSGATLQQSFFSAPASTNDFVDANNNGISTPTIEQLAAAASSNSVLPSTQWIVQCRFVGSLNGVRELLQFGRTYATLAGDISVANASDGAIVNRANYIASGAAGSTTGIAKVTNPGAAPFASLTDGSFRATTGAGGILIDGAPIDVALRWTLKVAGTSDPVAAPTAAGYGTNARVATDAAGNNTSLDNLLVDLGTANIGALANPPVAADANTLFDNTTAQATLAFITNYGTGLRQATAAELRTLFATGRTLNGENLIAVTRDVGSGSRNAAMNGICLDPSFGVGENIGPLANAGSQDQLGANFRPGNKGGSGRMEGTVQNHRLAIGYVGAERGVAASQNWLTNGRMDVLAVKNDGGTQFLRPTASNVVNNSTADSYRIAGVGGVITFGDPRAEPVGYPGFGDNNGNPRMRNISAAAYLNNITRSVAAFRNPLPPSTDFSPGEFLVANLILFNAVDALPNSNNHCVYTAQTADAFLKSYVLANSNLANALYANFNVNNNGFTPNRTTGVVYSDGVANGATYLTVNNTPVAINSNMNPTSALAAVGLRNKIAGDFNNDGVRDVRDAAAMVTAFVNRASLAVSDSNLVPEIIGDFNGDGNFDRADIRWFCDGLALDNNNGNKLNRMMGYMAVDTAFGGNFFGTTIATGKPYAAGDSAGDVAGPAGKWTRGFAPIGQDGVVDALDINYVRANFGTWSNLANAVNMDLSADMNGDLVVNSADVTKLVTVILGTTYGDRNLDGVVNAADLAGVVLGGTGWASGDMNGDGVIDAADVNYIKGRICPGDTNGDGLRNFTDLNTVLSNFGQSGQAVPGDFNGDGVVNFTDLNTMLSAFGTACP